MVKLFPQKRYNRVFVAFDWATTAFPDAFLDTSLKKFVSEFENNKGACIIWASSQW